MVDNYSIDNSIEMVRAKFPEFHLINNKVNLGFSKANNQAMKLAKGEYVLLLNPDTVVEEDCFEKVIKFMNEHPEAGGLGVKMVDGKGRFLPESKRGLPTPKVAFWKISGLASLFPKSKLFGQYHLGYLDENKIHEIEILSGAFMLMRKKAIDKVGLLDEAFFMYGEDIDLSYRITQGGFKNYYLPETSIIHYKGESTKKSSVNYVLVFYKAMVIFAKKHFSQKNAKLLSFFIYSAIYMRAGMAILSRMIKKIMLPAVDAIIIFGGLLSLTNYWKISNIEFPKFTFQIALPFYTLVWMINLYYQGNYDRPFKFLNSWKGVVVGTLFLLVIYALMPKEYQFSRLFILIGALWILLYIFLSRFFMHLFLGPAFSLSKIKNKSFAIVGSIAETERVEKLLKQTNQNFVEIFRVSSESEKSGNQIGTMDQLDQISYINKIDEIIFCAKDCSANSIIEWMQRLDSDNLDFKIAQPETIFLIGSNSIDTAGDLYLMEVNKIELPKNKRLKRLFDTSVASGMLLLSPILFWKFRNKRILLKNMLFVLWGKYSIVGYHNKNNSQNAVLPHLKYGILSPSDEPTYCDVGQVDKQNLLYARDYNILKDWKILRSCWGKLDRPLK